MVALNDMDEEGMHSPLLLNSLDLALWTSLFVMATTDKDRTLTILKVAHFKVVGVAHGGWVGCNEICLVGTEGWRDPKVGQRWYAEPKISTHSGWSGSQPQRGYTPFTC